MALQGLSRDFRGFQWRSSDVPVVLWSVPRDVTSHESLEVFTILTLHFDVRVREWFSWLAVVNHCQKWPESRQLD